MSMQAKNRSNLHLKENQNILKTRKGIQKCNTVYDRKVFSEITNVQPKQSLNEQNKEKIYNKKSNFNEIRKKFKTNVEKKEIINIDKLYEGNLCLVSEYANDIYKYLRQLEFKYTIGKWPFQNVEITDKIRTILVDWLVDVHVEYQLLQETLHTAISILDRYLEKREKINKDNIQLVGVTALYIACKYEELFCPSLEDFVYLCDQTYEKKDFILMEKAILETLNFELSRPISILFLRRYNMIIQADRTQHLYSKYIIDLALLDCSLCHENPSKIAAGSTFISICLVESKADNQFWNDSLIHYSTYTYLDIKELVNHLAKLVLRSVSTKYDSIRRKYSTKTHSNISSKIFTSLDIIRKLAS